MSEYHVSQPKEPSLYERMVGHRMEIEHVPGAYFGREHPDACPDCAANPEMATKVHAAEAGIAAAMHALEVFFAEDDVEPMLLQNMVMTMYMSMARIHQGLTEDEAVAVHQGKVRPVKEP